MSERAGKGGEAVRVTVKLFALARQKAGRAEAVLDLPESATVGDLKRVLSAQCPGLAPFVPNLMIAVAAEYAPDDMIIPAGAEVAAIPPVSGGSASTRPTTALTPGTDR